MRPIRAITLTTLGFMPGMAAALIALGGGVAVALPQPEDPEARTLTLDGFAAFGRIAVGAKAGAAEPER